MVRRFLLTYSRYARRNRQNLSSLSHCRYRTSKSDNFLEFVLNLQSKTPVGRG